MSSTFIGTRSLFESKLSWLHPFVGEASAIATVLHSRKSLIDRHRRLTLTPRAASSLNCQVPRGQWRCPLCIMCLVKALTWQGSAACAPRKDRRPLIIQGCKSRRGDQIQVDKSGQVLGKLQRQAGHKWGPMTSKTYSYSAHSSHSFISSKSRNAAPHLRSTKSIHGSPLGYLRTRTARTYLACPADQVTW